MLKDKRLNFGTFKNIYGHSEERGVRTVKIGNETLQVDNQNYTYKIAPPPENEARKRLLAHTNTSAQKVTVSSINLTAVAGGHHSTLQDKKKSNMNLPPMDTSVKRIPTLGPQPKS